MSHSLSTAFTESHTFGLSCLYFHLILCIFWFPFLILPWSVGYSVACCVGSFSSVQSFSRIKKWLHVLQHDRLPCQHQPPEFTQTHVHWVSDAIQPSHPLSSPSPPPFNLSQHQGLFKWVSSLHQMTKLLEFQLQHQSFQWTHRTDLL